MFSISLWCIASDPIIRVKNGDVKNIRIEIIGFVVTVWE